MCKILRKTDSYGVSTIIGYALTLGICAMVLTSSVIIVSTYSNRRNESAARIEAQSLANRVVNMINEIVNLKQMMPDDAIDYQKTMETPDSLSTYNYYIEISQSKVTVKTTNGRVSESCTTYNVEDAVLGTNSIIGSINSKGVVINGGNKIKLSIAPTSIPVDMIVENA